MMISEAFQDDVYIADSTNYNSSPDHVTASFTGVSVQSRDHAPIPSFVLKNENHVPVRVINNERNVAFYKRPDGTKVPQCECIIFPERNDNKKAWMVFLELKYCKAKNIYNNMLEGISQLKATCRYIFLEKAIFEEAMFKKFLVVSTPGEKPLDPFDSFYFNQDDMLRVKEETGAILKAANIAWVRTPAVIYF